jgi:hypothetical protein
VPCTSQLLHIFASACIDNADSLQPPKQEPTLNYNIIPKTANAAAADKRLEMVHDWLTFFNQPGDISDHDYDVLTRYAVGFFIDDAGMWQHNNHSAHKRILY